MKSISASLDRLLKAAAAAPRPAVGELPFAVENRVLADWRSPLRERELPNLVPLFRRGLAFACVLMVAAMAVGLTQGRPSSAEDWASLDADVNMALMR